MWSGEDWSRVTPFSLLGFFSIQCNELFVDCRSFVYPWIIKEHFITLNDHEPKTPPPTTCMIANN
jgi:hypothetical protein